MLLWVAALRNEEKFKLKVANNTITAFDITISLRHSNECCRSTCVLGAYSASNLLYKKCMCSMCYMYFSYIHVSSRDTWIDSARHDQVGRFSPCRSIYCDFFVKRSLNWLLIRSCEANKDSSNSYSEIPSQLPPSVNEKIYEPSSRIKHLTIL